MMIRTKLKIVIYLCVTLAAISSIANVFPINMPPLRDRREDIPQLVWFFVKEYSRAMGKSINQIPKKTMDLLQSYYWPGNVRELKKTLSNGL